MNSIKFVEAKLRLFEIFNEYSLKSSSQLQGLPKLKRKNLDATIYAWFAGFQDVIISEIRKFQGLNLCLGWNKRTSSFKINSGPGTSVKKLSFFSNTAIILTPEFRHPGCKGQTIPSAWYELILAFWPLVETGYLLVLPKGITYLIEKPTLQTAGQFSGALVNYGNTVTEETWLLLKEKLPSLTIVDVSKESLKSQMYEYNPYDSISDSKIFIHLPHLSGLKIDTLVDIRKHHGDLFAKYNSTISSFFQKSEKASNEKLLLDIMRQTDEEIKRLDMEINKISQSKALETLGVSAQLSIGVLCVFLPYETAKFFSVLAGGGAIEGVLKYFRLELQKKSLLQGNPFYFPWIIHQLASKLSPDIHP